MSGSRENFPLTQTSQIGSVYIQAERDRITQLRDDHHSPSKAPTLLDTREIPTIVVPPFASVAYETTMDCPAKFPSDARTITGRQITPEKPICRNCGMCGQTICAQVTGTGTTAGGDPVQQVTISYENRCPKAGPEQTAPREVFLFTSKKP